MLPGLARTQGRHQKQAPGLTWAGLSAIRAVACLFRRRGRRGRPETAGHARRRGLVDIAIASVMRDGLLRCSEAAWEELIQKFGRLGPVASAALEDGP